MGESKCFLPLILLYGSMAAGQKDVDYGQHAGKWTTINSKATHGIMRGLTVYSLIPLRLWDYIICSTLHLMEGWTGLPLDMLVRRCHCESCRMSCGKMCGKSCGKSCGKICGKTCCKSCGQRIFQTFPFPPLTRSLS